MKKTAISVLLSISLYARDDLYFVKDSINNYIIVASKVLNVPIINSYDLKWDISASYPRNIDSRSIFNDLVSSLRLHGFDLVKRSNSYVVIANPNSDTKIIRSDNVDTLLEMANSKAFLIKQKYGIDIIVYKKDNSVIISGNKKFVDQLDNELRSITLIRENTRDITSFVKVIEVSNSKTIDVGVKYGVISDRVSEAKDVVASLLSKVTEMASLGYFAKNIGTVDKPILLRSVINFLVSESSLRVVTEGVIRSSDGRPATIRDGSEIFVKSSVNRYNQTSYEVKKVGLSLTITPKIDDDKIDLRIDLSLKDLNRYDGNNNPIISSKIIKTAVMIEPNTLLLIGSTSKTVSSGSVDSLPLLGWIPFFGGNKNGGKSDKSMFIMIKSSFDSSLFDTGETEKINAISTALKEELEKENAKRLIFGDNG